MAMSEPVQIEVRRATPGDRSAILALHKTRKATLGHLPHAPFDQAIEYGWILVATRKAALIGYLLYRVRKTTDDVAVVHLAVAVEEEGRGVGRELLARMLEEISELRRVVLSCRQDYPAHDFWMKSGFEAIGETPGRSRTGTRLTKFERRLRHEPTLFDQLYEESVPFAVDLNILLDLVIDREPETRAIFDQLDQFNVHPMRTLALSNELLDYKDQSVRTQARSLTSIWDAPESEEHSDRLAELVRDIPHADVADLRHLVSAEANGLSVLVSRDRDFAEAVAASGAATTVEVLHPAVFVDRLFRSGASGYMPSAVRGLAFEAASAFTPTLLADVFVASSHGERKADLRSAITAAFASDSVQVNCLTRDGEPVCLYKLTETARTVEVGLFRTVHGAHRATIIRQALAHLRVQAASESLVRILTVSEPALLQRDARSFASEGFVETDDGWVGTVTSGVHTHESLEALLPPEGITEPSYWRSVRRAIADSLANPEAAALVEGLMDPVVLVDGALEAVLVPIQAGWSDRLIGVTADQLDLEIASERIHQLREHVYFRSPKGLGLTAPLRVFWYRTAEGRSRVFATSVIDQVSVRSMPEIWGRFGGYGVLQKAEVAGRSDEAGQVMALRFVRTRRLRRSIELSELQTVAAQIGAVRPAVPVGPLRLDQRLHSWLLSEEVGLE